MFLSDKGPMLETSISAEHQPFYISIYTHLSRTVQHINEYNQFLPK